MANITQAKEIYEIRKAQGSPLVDTFKSIAQVISQHEYQNRWQLLKQDQTRNYEGEAMEFGKNLARHMDYLKGKRLIVYESTSYGHNSPAFKVAFEKVLHRDLPELKIEVLDVTTATNKHDYFWLDDHPRASFYSKVADMLAPHLKTGA